MAFTIPALKILARLGTMLLDAVLPPRCLGCAEPVARQGGMCPACWARLRFVTAPLCPCCGTPFREAAAAAGPCVACLALPPRFARARTVLVYDDASRPLMLGFKHGDQTHRAQAFGAWMARAGAELLADADLLVPVPLHRLRLFSRRYNQTALLALAAGRASGVRAGPDVLSRRHRTRTQGGLTRSGRERNVKGAFAVRDRWRSRIAGRRIVLVDDVLTTGATVNECAKVLLRAGAARVDVLTFARVVREG